jgi:hypothetical protein
MKYPKSNMDFGKNDTIYHPFARRKKNGAPVFFP